MLSYNTVSAANLHDSYFDYINIAYFCPIQQALLTTHKLSRWRRATSLSCRSRCAHSPPPALVPFAGLCF